MDDTTSLSSESDVLSLHSIAEPVPLQADPARKPSLLRRLSTITTNFFDDESINSSETNYRQRAIRAEQSDLYNLHTRDLDSEYILAHKPISNTFSRIHDEEDDVEEFPQIYGASSRRPSTATERELRTRPTRRDTIASAIQSVTKKLGFWDKDFHADRIKIVLTFGINYIYLIVGFLVALCIYWGSFYGRTGRFKNLDFAIVVADTQVGELPAILGPTVEYLFTNVTALQALGKFHIIDYDNINSQASAHNITISAAVKRIIHHEKYWAAFYVYPNATLTLYENMKAVNSSFSPAESLMEVYYETGRDFNAVNNYITVVIDQILKAYYLYMLQSGFVSELLQTINSTEASNVLKNAPGILTNSPGFKLTDGLPAVNPVIQAPFQIGLIYIVLFSFFQFIFLAPIHMFLALKIKGLSYIAYRLMASHSAYLVIGLSYVTLNTAFQISYSTTFGRLGFLVLWAFAYLTIASLGSLIEALGLLALMIKPQLIGFILLAIAVINVAPTISPPVLCPTFYRYGYGVPVRNAYELLQVSYLDAYKGHMGRNIGVLIAWIILSTIVIVIVMIRMAAIQKRIAKSKEKSKAREEKFRQKHSGHN